MPDSTVIIAEASRRLRDTTNFAHSTAVLTRFLDHSQKIMNFAQQLVLTTTSFTTTARRVLYANTEVSATFGQVVTIRDSKRNLFEVPWRSLVHNDPKWYRRVGQRPETFARVGHDLLIITPATFAPVTLDVVYSKVTATPTGVPGDVEIPQEFATNLVDMIELLALLRGRRLGETLDLFKRIPDFFIQQGQESIEAP